MDIYFSPSSVFERRSDGRFWPALVVVTIVLTALTYAFFSALSAAYAADISRAIARAGQDPEVAQAVTGLTSSLAVFGSVVMVPVGVLITGLLLLLIGRMFGADLNFAQGTTIATYATFPRVLATLAGTIQGVLLNPNSMSAVSTGPARFLDPDTASESLLALAARLDIFILWSVVLTAIGVRIIGRTQGGSAWGTAIVVWVIASIPAVVGLLLAA